MKKETALKAKKIIEQLKETDKIIRILSTPFNKVEIFIQSLAEYPPLLSEAKVGDECRLFFY